MWLCLRCITNQIIDLLCPQYQMTGHLEGVEKVCGNAEIWGRGGTSNAVPTTKINNYWLSLANLHALLASVSLFLCIGLAMSFRTWQTDREHICTVIKQCIFCTRNGSIHWRCTILLFWKKINNHNTNIFAPFSWRQQPQGTPQQTHAGLLLTGWPHKQQ